MRSRLDDAVAALMGILAGMGEDERIDAINRVREAVHEVSPLRAEPVDCVLWVRSDRVRANDYNPNSVAPPEMRLLEESIRLDGFTQPIVVFRQGTDHEVVDGFHRNRVGRESVEVKARVRGRLPVAVVNGDRTETKDRIAATIRHNRARGVHGVEPMAQIVARLYFMGWSNKRIREELGMDDDEVLRLKQFTGLGTLFEHRAFSKSWDLEDSEQACEGDD